MVQHRRCCMAARTMLVAVGGWVGQWCMAAWQWGWAAALRRVCCTAGPVAARSAAWQLRSHGWAHAWLVGCAWVRWHLACVDYDNVNNKGEMPAHPCAAHQPWQAAPRKHQRARGAVGAAGCTRMACVPVCWCNPGR